ncbi:MAG TPA: trypsin-like peptidase domain-containing protein [Myxococcales bacterium]|nr:trypsin-like peptidase domain-containing protein [Myxococcales bacterium]
MTLALALLLAARPLWTDAPQAKERATAPPASIAALVKVSMPAVVGIVATTARSGSNDPFREFLERMYGQSGGGPSETPVRGIGTGFFVRADGLIATNGHVIEGATDITVQVGEDERVYRGTLVGHDDATDLALLKIEGDKPFPVLPLGESDRLEVGEWVVAIGNPFGLSRSVTTGIVSFKGRRDVNPSGKPGYYDFIQTDAAINPGNSGGPLLDARGAVIGINAAVNPSGQGIGFAIPVEQLRDVAPQLAARGHVVRSYMGISIQESMSAELAESFGVPSGKGVVVTEVTEDGPAARAGIKPGDVIVSFEGETLVESYRLRWLTARTTPGKRVRVGLWRAGKAQEVQVLLLEKPGAAWEPRPPSPALRRDQEPFGFAVEDPPKDDGDHGRGVRVSSIDLRGCAYRAGVREGDLILEVDGQPVIDKAAYRKVISSTGPVSRLYVRRGAKALFFGLRREAPLASRARSGSAGDATR